MEALPEDLSIHEYLVQNGSTPWGVFDSIEAGVDAYMSSSETMPRRDQGIDYLPIPGNRVPEAQDSFPGKSLEGKVVFYKGKIPEELAAALAIAISKLAKG